MCSEIATEIGLSFGARPTFKALFEGIVGSLKERSRLIIVDEINIPPTSCLHTIRDIHDLSDNPFLLIGHEGVLQRLKPIGPLFDRLLYIQEFKPFSYEDLKDFAGQILDIPATDDAVAKVLKLTQGSVRKSIVLLKGAEDRAKAGRAATIGPEHLPRE
jgi:DNA transposition AAA+ family ATPase